MRGMVPPECETGPSGQHYATVYMPKFKVGRQRFSAACIEVMADAESVTAACEGDEKRFPAVVVGPSKSSEGQYLYYLVKWL
ncbi:MAG: hypothetical protein ACPGSM_08480 [Thiolinea sp.]